MYYHVTESKNVSSILKEGLNPNIGGYAKEMGENNPAVWLFPTLDDAKEMIPVWLEPYYGSDLTVLEVELPEDFPIDYTGSDYEVITTKPIPAKYIKICEERS